MYLHGILNPSCYIHIFPQSMGFVLLFFCVLLYFPLVMYSWHLICAASTPAIPSFPCGIAAIVFMDYSSRGAMKQPKRLVTMRKQQTYAKGCLHYRMSRRAPITRFFHEEEGNLSCGERMSPTILATKSLSKGSSLSSIHFSLQKQDSCVNTDKRPTYVKMLHEGKQNSRSWAWDRPGRTKTDNLKKLFSPWTGCPHQTSLLLLSNKIVNSSNKG